MRGRSAGSSGKRSTAKGERRRKTCFDLDSASFFGYVLAIMPVSGDLPLSSPVPTCFNKIIDEYPLILRERYSNRRVGIVCHDERCRNYMSHSLRGNYSDMLTLTIVWRRNGNTCETARTNCGSRPSIPATLVERR